MKYNLTFAFAILIILVAILAISSRQAYAQSISVSPDRLNFVVNGDSDEKQLAVYNGNNEELKFRVSAEKFHDWFRFDRSEFWVKPGRFEKVRVSVVPDESNGNYESEIAVYPSSEPDSNVAVQLGAVVKAKVTVARSASRAVGLIVSSSIILIGLLCYFYVRK